MGLLSNGWYFECILHPIVGHSRGSLLCFDYRRRRWVFVPPNTKAGFLRLRPNFWYAVWGSISTSVWGSISTSFFYPTLKTFSSFFCPEKGGLPVPFQTGSRRLFSHQRGTGHFQCSVSLERCFGHLLPA